MGKVWEILTNSSSLIALRKGSKKKKNLEFSRFGLTHPPHPCNRRKSGKKNKIFIVLKWFLGNFEQFWKNLFFHPENAKKFWTWCWPNVSCHTLYSWQNALKAPPPYGRVNTLFHFTVTQYMDKIFTFLVKYF